MDGGVAATVNAPTCNKRELARLLPVSLPTLDKMIADNPDFPIEGKGSNGREYEFDLVKVQAWRAAKLEEERAHASERMSALGVFDFGDDAPANSSPTQMFALARYERERRKLAQEAGLLIDVATLRVRTQPVIMDLALFLDALPDTIGRKLKLTPAMVEEVRVLLEEGRNDFVVNMVASLEPPKELEHDLLAGVG